VSTATLTRPDWSIEIADHLPQSWRDVVSPPPEIAAVIGRRLESEAPGALAEERLAALVAHVAEHDDIWRPLVVADLARRRYRLVYEDARLDLWVLSWMPGQGTGFHDHASSSVALTAVTGSVIERRLSATAGHVARPLAPGEIRTGGAGYIHAVGHQSGVPAVTIHAYSPPLLEVGQYRATPDGMLWREPQHGRQELLDHTVDRATAGD
jgi:predicted metal-dependent enzyme (double-stranded beta helix superfamily)